MSDSSVPSECHACSQHMQSPLCCQSCGALNLKLDEGYDYFEMFGLGRQYDLDTKALHRMYLSLARATHPDMSGSKTNEVRQRVLNINAELNQAYDTLKSPVGRAEYLLTLLGGPSAAEDKTVPGNVLGEVMMWREELEEAADASDQATIESIRQQVQAKRDSTYEEIGRLGRALAPGATETFTLLRHTLNTVKYWDNLLEQLPVST